ncbi:MAG: glucosamine-6-phosphate deaminase [Lachnospiraceae bacterium]|jgi:glucosamine-6-phosphate deaminase
MRVIIQENYDKACKWTAEHIADAINAHEENRPFVLGLPTGSSPLGIYAELIEMNKAGKISFKNVITFNMDEYLGLSKEHEQSYCHYMWKNFFDHIDIPVENVNIPNGIAEDPDAECVEYEKKIAACGGIDLFLGGIGVDGHIAFNEPLSSLASRTRVISLAEDTIIANSRFFGDDLKEVPDKALTVGVGTITDAREVILIVSGHSKARALARTIEGGLSQMWPASALQAHPNALIACDEAACGELKVNTFNYFLTAEKNERL